MDGRTIRLERRHRLDCDRALSITDERFEGREASGATWELRREHRREHRHAIVTWPELATALGAAGLGSLRTFTSFAARAPEPFGPGRMLVVAPAR